MLGKSHTEFLGYANIALFFNCYPVNSHLAFYMYNILSAKKLAEELDGWIRAAGLVKSSDVRGVIAP